jgi:hypothetical protein
MVILTNPGRLATVNVGFCVFKFNLLALFFFLGGLLRLDGALPSGRRTTGIFSVRETPAVLISDASVAMDRLADWPSW